MDFNAVFTGRFGDERYIDTYDGMNFTHLPN